MQCHRYDVQQEDPQQAQQPTAAYAPALLSEVTHAIRVITLS